MDERIITIHILNYLYWDLCIRQKSMIPERRTYMLNTTNFIIDLNGMESNFTQMKNAIEVALKAALSNTVEVVDQLMMQSEKDHLHVKTDGVEIISAKDKILVLSKNIKLAATMEDICDMDYDLSHFSLHKQTELLNALIEVGYILESGKLNIDTDFKSDGMLLSALVLDKLNTNDMSLNAIFNGYKINIKQNEVLIDNKLIYQNGVLYYNAYYCKALIDLFSKTLPSANKKVKAFSNENIKEWPCKA